METAVGHRSRASTKSEAWACCVLTKEKIGFVLDDLCRLLRAIQEITYGPFSLLNLCFFPKLVQEPGERCREKA